MQKIEEINGLLLIGCGKMGSAILDGALDKGLNPQKVRVIDPSSEIRAGLDRKGIKTSENISDFHDFTPEIILAAVKPFTIEAVAPSLKAFTDKGAVLVSIIAGRQIKWFEEKLGKKAAIIRAMPNTPAAVGRGITGLMASASITEKQKESVQVLFDACGEAVWLDKESQIDAVTAISGSGPAYVFYFTEALTNAAVSLGLPLETAKKLAKATVCGAAELMYQSAETPETLRQNVTTPNGTTAAALEILTDSKNGLSPLMEKAAKAAEIRSKELASA